MLRKPDNTEEPRPEGTADTRVLRDRSGKPVAHKRYLAAQRKARRRGLRLTRFALTPAEAAAGVLRLYEAGTWPSCLNPGLTFGTIDDAEEYLGGNKEDAQSPHRPDSQDVP